MNLPYSSKHPDAAVEQRCHVVTSQVLGSWHMTRSSVSGPMPWALRQLCGGDGLRHSSSLAQGRCGWRLAGVPDGCLCYTMLHHVTPCYTMLHHMEEHETRWFDLWPWAFPFVICGWPMVAPSHPKSPEVHHHGEALQLPLTANAGWHAGWHRAHVLWSWLVSLEDTDRFG